MIDSKRLFDVSASTAGLILGAPVLLLAAIAVRIDSSGPILFRQERVGLNGRPFRIRKFRTMHQGSSGLAITSRGDQRITSVGRILRSTKLDELPQLLDVLGGQMSIVGPRPEVPKYVDLWPAQARDVILSVRPGITDPASIRFRHESDELAAAPDPEAYYVSAILPEKVRMYTDYAQNHGLFRDLVLIAGTIRAVILK